MTSILLPPPPAFFLSGVLAAPLLALPLVPALAAAWSLAGEDLALATAAEVEATADLRLEAAAEADFSSQTSPNLKSSGKWCFLMQCLFLSSGLQNRSRHFCRKHSYDALFLQRVNRNCYSTEA